MTPSAMAPPLVLMHSIFPQAKSSSDFYGTAGLQMAFQPCFDGFMNRGNVLNR